MTPAAMQFGRIPSPPERSDIGLTKPFSAIRSGPIPQGARGCRAPIPDIATMAPPAAARNRGRSAAPLRDIGRRRQPSPTGRRQIADAWPPLAAGRSRPCPVPSRPLRAAGSILPPAARPRPAELARFPSGPSVL